MDNDIMKHIGGATWQNDNVHQKQHQQDLGKVNLQNVNDGQKKEVNIAQFTRNKKLKVLVACEFSGIVREAFKAKGHDAWSCDLLDTEIPGQHIKGDVLEILEDGWDLMIAHPPCTYLTVTGNKWFKPEFKDRFPDRAKQRDDAIKFFMDLANAPINKIAVENPVGIMSSTFRKPDCIIQPFNYGQPVRKTTCLWLKNLPPLMSLHRYPDEIVKFKSGGTMSKFHYETASLNPEQRAREHSKTFPGIAKAMAEQWG